MTSATLRLPTPLRAFCGGSDELCLDGATVGELLDTLVTSHPGMRGRILDESGALRRFVNVFVDGQNARGLGGLAAAVPHGAVVTIVPAVAGGAS